LGASALSLRSLSVALRRFASLCKGSAPSSTSPSARVLQASNFDDKSGCSREVIVLTAENLTAFLIRREIFFKKDEKV